MAADFSKYKGWKQIERDIGALKIQGARNVTLGSLHAMRLAAGEAKAGEGKRLMENLGRMAARITKSRPTEPMTRAILSAVIKYGTAIARQEKTAKKAIDIGKRIGYAVGKVESIMDASRKRMTDIGANYMENGTTLMTYCHSSSVTGAIKKAHDMGKIEKVYVCETRPKYQGRITAAELAGHGIDTYLIVDGAMATYAKKADMAVVGADAITSTGDLINKIGSCSLSIVFKTYEKPFVSITEALKFDPETAFGFNEKIENRDIKEIWERPAKRLKLLNPAFDQTPARNIAAYVTSAGIFPPSDIEKAYEMANKELTEALG